MKEVFEQQNKDEDVSYSNDKIIDSSSRRKAVKAFVGGVTALAAYNLLPAKWGTPYVESVFLPAHAATSGASGNELAASKYEYVGYWEVGYGPSSSDEPVCYTGQEAAAILFGGNASDYAISTVSKQVSEIDFQAYVSSKGGLEAPIQAQDYKVDHNNDGYNDDGDISAYVRDNNQYNVNYAFRIIS